MDLQLYEAATVASDLPEQRLRGGEVVIVVEKLHAPDGKRGYCVEVLNERSEAVDVALVGEEQLEPLRGDGASVSHEAKPELTVVHSG